MLRRETVPNKEMRRREFLKVGAVAVAGTRVGVLKRDVAAVKTTNITLALMDGRGFVVSEQQSVALEIAEEGVLKNVEEIEFSEAKREIEVRGFQLYFNGKKWGDGRLDAVGHLDEGDTAKFAIGQLEIVL